MGAGTTRAGGICVHDSSAMSSFQTTVRKNMRAARRALTPKQQRIAAQGLLNQIFRHPLYLNSRRIAFYLPNDGEIDPTPVLIKALECKKSCYLPVLYRGGEDRLIFGRTVSLDDMTLNRFGIPEPNIAKNGWVFSNQLDLIFAPLVAFDDQGNRIGMGGGFYDRSLEHLRLERTWQRPHVIGLAHEFQHVENIGRNAWDVPLRGAITDKNTYKFTD